MKNSDERATPLELFNLLNDEFHFDIDVCAMQANAKLPNYFHIGQDGLKQDWAPKRCFMNPPFSELSVWLDKALRESIKGALVVCILPNDSSTKWFHEYIWDSKINFFRKEVNIRYPNKRYSFGEYSNTSKFAILIAIFGLK